MLRRRLAGALALLCLSAAGCGNRTATVAGRVTHLGKPVTGGSVIVYCADRQIVRGVIAVDGTYTIPNVPYGPATVTVQAAPGAPAGLRMRQITPAAVDGPIPPAVPADGPTGPPIPPRYAVPVESGLSVAVDRAAVTYDIDLKP
jgi:hypothetical protein